jgi:hypothetical protein
MVIIVIHVIAIFDAGSVRFTATSLCTDVLLDCPKMCHKFNPLEAGAPSARFTERLEANTKHRTVQASYLQSEPTDGMAIRKFQRVRHRT